MTLLQSIRAAASFAIFILTLPLLLPTSSTSTGDSVERMHPRNMASDGVPCLDPPLASDTCTRVESWEDLVAATALNTASGASLVLCPFNVARSGSDPVARFKRPISVLCQKLKEGDECVLEGPRTQITIEGPEAEVTFVGMTFRGATKGAIKVLKSANKGTQTFCGCLFDGNRRRGKKLLGGAVVALRGTRTVFSSCTFTNNYAKEGSALYNQGKMEVYNSTFQSHSGGGSIIDNRRGSKLLLEGTSFMDNAKNGWAVSVQKRRKSWIDGGRNSGVGNWRCNGFYNTKSKNCTEFIVSGVELQTAEKAQISTNKRTYEYAEDVFVSFTSPEAKKGDWVAVIPSGSANNGEVSEIFIDWDGGWQEPCGLNVCSDAVMTGNLVFKDLKAGNHQVVILESSINRMYPVLASSDAFTINGPPFTAYVPGRLTTRDYETGLILADGLSVEVLARVGYKVRFTSPRAQRPESTIAFHSTPDGGAVFPRANGGWIYMSNSEVGDLRGGVFAVVFDANGKIEDYQQRLGRTTRNCAGGKTPWNTWISCEEHSNGQCWQCDPEGRRSPERTNLVERSGGNFETVAVDKRDMSKITFFTTEDHEYGALRRFRPNPAYVHMGWDMLHTDGFTLDYLLILPGGRFTWTRSLDEGRASAHAHFPYSEGIDHRDGKVYFVAKKIKRLLILDLDRMTYRTESTDSGLMKNGGGFYNDPDQVVSLSGKYIYFTEDGGWTPGVYARELATGDYYTVFEADGFDGDETTGIAFSPDGRILYCCLQWAGVFFAVTRKDGMPFEGTTMSLKFHKMKGQR